jgi:hypothetical protein
VNTLSYGDLGPPAGLVRRVTKVVASSGRLSEFDRRDGPLPFVASDRDAQAMYFVEPNALDRTGLSVGQDHGCADKLSLGLLKFAEDRELAREGAFSPSAPLVPSPRAVPLTCKALNIVRVWRWAIIGGGRFDTGASDGNIGFRADVPRRASGPRSGGSEASLFDRKCLEFSQAERSFAAKRCPLWCAFRTQVGHRARSVSCCQMRKSNRTARSAIAAGPRSPASEDIGPTVRPPAW